MPQVRLRKADSAIITFNLKHILSAQLIDDIYPHRNVGVKLEGVSFVAEIQKLPTGENSACSSDAKTFIPTYT